MIFFSTNPQYGKRNLVFTADFKLSFEKKSSQATLWKFQTNSSKHLPNWFLVTLDENLREKRGFDSKRVPFQRKKHLDDFDHQFEV